MLNKISKLIPVVIINLALLLAVPQYTNYQGRLVEDGVPYNGAIDMKFAVM